ncbi:hypothetical protein LTR67_007285 [Exophiala xenobiotica]
MAAPADMDDTQRLSDLDETSTEHAPLPRGQEGNSIDVDFARLTPRNPAAKQAFHEVALKLSDEQWLPHVRKFIHIYKASGGQISAPEQGHLLSQHDRASSPSISQLSEDEGDVPIDQYTGYFRFSLGLLPADFRQGWIIGSGRADKANLGVDILLTSNGVRDFVRGRHALILHHRQTGVLILKAAVRKSLISLDADTIDHDGRALSRPSHSVEIGNLSYTLDIVHQPSAKEQYMRALNDLMEANAKWNAYPSSSLDLTPSAQNIQVGDYSIQLPQVAGTYGLVSAAVHLPSGEVYAVKRIPHICTLSELLSRGADLTSEVYLIISPFAPETLYKLMTPSTDISEKLRAIHHIAQGLRYIHSRGVIHRDLKPSNLLITQPFRVVIADFGHSNREKKSIDHMKGTLDFLPPEIQDLKNKSRNKSCWSFASDVFTFGFIAFELLYGQFRRSERRLIGPDVREAVRHQLRTSTSIDTLLYDTLLTDPAERPDMMQVCLANIWPDPETSVKEGKRKLNSS